MYIATRLDGFIARRDGNLDWLLGIENPGNEDYGYNAFFSRIDAIGMGRGTFETVLRFPNWPYDKPAFALSSTFDGDT